MFSETPCSRNFILLKSSAIPCSCICEDMCTLLFAPALQFLLNSTKIIAQLLSALTPTQKYLQLYKCYQTTMR